MIKSLVGLKTGATDTPKKSYHIYDKCDICPLSVYIDVVCNDNLKALIIKGSVPDEDLLIARTTLTIELSELSGDTQTASVINIIRQMYLRKCQIQGLRISANLIAGGRFEEALEYLRPYHIKIDVNSQESIERGLKQIDGKVKGKIISMQELQKRYEALTAKSDSGKPKADNYTEILISLSKHVGFHLKKEELTLSEFAFYLKSFNRELERLNNKSYGGK